MKNIKIFLLLIVLTGCHQAPVMDWVPTNFAKTDAYQAKSECEFEAEKSAPTSDLSKGAFSIVAMQKEVFNKCMKARGFIYSQVPSAVSVTLPK